jgi:hypothetical protein
VLKLGKLSKMKPVEVRSQLVEALRLDQVGPENGSELETEVLACLLKLNRQRAEQERLSGAAAESKRAETNEASHSERPDGPVRSYSDPEVNRPT